MPTFTITVPEGPDVPWLEFFDRLERYGMIANLFDPSISYSMVRDVCSQPESMRSQTNTMLVWRVVCQIHFNSDRVAPSW